MQEQMLAWVRLHGQENFPGEMNYLLDQSKPLAHASKASGASARLAATFSSSSPSISSSSAASSDPTPRLLWVSHPAVADATIVQGSSVLRWGQAQRVVQPWQSRLPDWQRSVMVLEPTTAGVPPALRVDPRSSQQLQDMWASFAAELEPIRLQFVVGLRSFSLLSRIQNPHSSQSHYHMEWQHAPMATLQPASGWLHLSPSAQPRALMQASWRRRSARASSPSYSRLSTAQALGVYCQRTTRRLFTSRMRTAQISLRAEAVVRLSEHSDQVLSVLVQLRMGSSNFSDLAHKLEIGEERLGNALLGLYLSGIVKLELSTAVQTLFSHQNQI
jgi:hypothetical protein